MVANENNKYHKNLVYSIQIILSTFNLDGVYSEDTTVYQLQETVS